MFLIQIFSTYLRIIVNLFKILKSFRSLRETRVSKDQDECKIFAY